jgi:tetratricopeptide (TPR) repeat protein
MKKHLFVPLLIVLCLSITGAFAADDEKAITEVIEKEYKAYVDKDLDAWSGYWVHEPYVSALWIGAMNYELVKSFDSLKVKVEKWMQAEDQGGTDIEKKIKEINVSGNMATVFLKETEVWKFAGEATDIKMKSVYVLQKVGKEWKIVSMTTVNKSSYENNDFTSEWKINMEGYRFLWRDELDKAIKVFELNTQLYPEAFNTWDSLGEAYMKKGDNEQAKKYYEKSLALNPKNDNAKKMLEKIEKGE